MNRRAFTKRILAGGAALWVPHVLAAPPPMLQRVISRPARTAAVTASRSYVLTEDCESSPVGWTDSGSVTWEYATSPAPLLGAKSVLLDGSAANATSQKSLTSASEYWGYFLLNCTLLPSSGGSRAFLYLRNGTTVVCTWFIVGTTGLIKATPLGGSSVTTTDGISASTLYHIWVHYKAASIAPGSDAIAEAEFSTTATRLGSGNKYIICSNGTNTANVDNLRLSAQFSTYGIICLYDKIRFDIQDIGSNPT